MLPMSSITPPVVKRQVTIRAISLGRRGCECLNTWEEIQIERMLAESIQLEKLAVSDVYCHKVRLAVVLIKDDRLLLVRQNNRDFWVFPGGTLEADEGLQECAIREMKEETNLDVAIERTLYVADFMQGVKNGAHRHTIDVFMLGKHLGGEPVMETTQNINEMGFFTIEDFMRMPVEPAVAADRLRRDWPAQFKDSQDVYIGKYGITSP